MLFVNDNPIKCGKFPNGETYVDFDGYSHLGPNYEMVITMRYESNDDIVNLILLKNALDDMGFNNIRLRAPFFPYETMDRSEGRRAISAKYIASLINSMHFVSVEIWEPHSDVILACLNRVHAIDKTVEIAKKVIGDNKNVLVVFPDSGAGKRYKNSFPGIKTAEMSKSRDFETGELSYNGFTGKVPEITYDTKVIIVDDLCRKGGTFALAAKCLKEHGAHNVELVVTHCENTIHKGLIASSDLIDKVYTTDSILTENADWIEIVEKII